MLVLDKLSVLHRDLVNRFLYLITRICVRPFLDPKLAAALEANQSDLAHVDYYPEGFPGLKTSLLKPVVNPMKIDPLLKALATFWACSFDEELFSLIYHKYLMEIYASSVALAFSTALKSSPRPLVPFLSIHSVPSFEDLRIALSLPNRGPLEISLSDKKWVESFLDYVLSQMDLTESVTTLLSIVKNTSQQWISSRCGSYLSQILLRPGGLLPTLVPIIGIDLDLESSDSVILTEQLQRAANLIVTVPRQASSPPDYYKLIIPQVFDLILKDVPADVLIIPSKSKINSSQLKARFAETGSLILSLILQKHTDLGQALIVTPSLKPLQLLAEISPPNAKIIPIPSSMDLGEASVSARELLLSVTCLISLLTYQPPRAVVSALKDRPSLLSLFRLYIFSLKSRSSLKDLLEHLLQLALALSQPQELVQALTFFLSNWREEDFKAHPGRSDEGSLEIRSEALSRISLLDSSDNDGAAEGFVRLLSSKELTDRFGNLASRVFVNLLSTLSQPEAMSPRLIHGITSLLNTFGEFLFISPNGKDSIDTVQFLVSLKTLIPGDYELTELASTILLVALSGPIKIKREEEILVSEIAALLKEVPLPTEGSEGEPPIRSLLHLIRNEKSKWLEGEEERDLRLSKKPTATELARLVASSLRDLKQSDIITKNQAMVAIRNLVVNERARLTSDQVSQLLTELSAQLTSDENFVFEGAILGLSAIGDVFLDQTLAALKGVYLDSKRPVSLRVKCVEVVYQICVRLGELLPFHADKVMALFFDAFAAENLPKAIATPPPKLFSKKKIVVLGEEEEDEDEVSAFEPKPVDQSLLSIDEVPSDWLVRASALASIARICRELNWSIQGYVERIVAIVFGVLNSLAEPVEVKRGALVLVVEIFDGLGVNAMTVLRSHLPALFSQLLQIAENDSDPTSREHAQDALASLEKILAKFTSSDEEAIPEWAKPLRFVKNDKAHFLL